jgi:hypothetical protein
MNEEKRFGGLPQGSSGSDKGGEEKPRSQGASRARNRTVMLTPEMTGQVRALLYQDPSEEPQASEDSRRDPINQLLPPVDWSRPDRAPASAPVPEAPREAVAQSEQHDDYGRDLSPPIDRDRSERGSSTGKIDTAPVQEALSAQPEQRRSPTLGGPGGGFSVNSANARPASPASAPIGSRRFGMDPRKAAAPTSRIVGFLVSFDKEKNGEVHEIRAGRWLVTSRPTDQGEYLLIDDPSISPLHAIIRATKDGKIEVLDQLSEFGTEVVRTATHEAIDAAGVRVSVSHGDVVRFGERAFVLCTVPAIAQEDAGAETEG